MPHFANFQKSFIHCIHLTYHIMSDAINDPVSVFYHADVKCESITERNWQRLNVDRVVSSQFNATGTLCAMYISYNSIEIWDFSSIPMPITSLGIPRHLTGRIEGQCFASTWSPCSKQIIGIFGNKSNAKRHSVPLSVETNRYSYICVWDIESRRVTHKYRYCILVLIYYCMYYSY